MNHEVLKLLAAIKKAARHPDLFSDGEREAMVDWLMACMHSQTNWVAIKAAEACIALERSNIAAERLAGTVGYPWATHGATDAVTT